MSEPEIEPVRTEFYFEAQVDCEAPRVIGASTRGTHPLIPIVGGTFAGGASAARSGPYARTTPRFEAAANGPHAWLNQSLFVGTLAVLNFRPLRVQVRCFRVL